MNDQLELDSLLKQMAESDHPDLPGPGLIWWRAQILKKQQEKERIERPVILMRLLATGVCAVAFIFLLAGNWRQFKMAVPENSWLWTVLVVFAVVVSILSVFLFWPRASTRANGD